MMGALRFSPSGRDLAAAKASRAYDRARNAGGLDRLWADTLSAAEGQPAVTAAEMYRRSEHLFILVADRGIGCTKFEGACTLTNLDAGQASRNRTGPNVG